MSFWGEFQVSSENSLHFGSNFFLPKITSLHFKVGIIWLKLIILCNDVKIFVPDSSTKEIIVANSSVLWNLNNLRAPLQKFWTLISFVVKLCLSFYLAWIWYVYHLIWQIAHATKNFLVEPLELNFEYFVLINYSLLQLWILMNINETLLELNFGYLFWLMNLCSLKLSNIFSSTTDVTFSRTSLIKF